jgi:beta-lactamase class C
VPAGVLARDEFLKELPALLLKDTVDRAIEPLMKQYDIPGMAVAVTDNGRNYFFNYGLASRETGQAVTSHTLFEIGSLSKTMAATLTSYAQVNGQLALTDSVSRHMPKLRGSGFDNISLLNLGTHTAGDFPMQVPDNVETYDQLMAYYKNWKPGVAAGSARTYSNLSIGLLGIITAQSMGMPFAEAMENKLFPQLGMHHSYIDVPAAEMKNYAQGYNQANAPVRVNPGVLATEAYGVKTDTADLIRFIDANMGVVKLDDKLQRAVTGTHTAYFKTGELTQDLIWEQYPAASKLDRMLAGVSKKMVFETNASARLVPPIPPQADVLIHKTGSTGGFGAYALFNPGKRMGIVMLANKSYPGAERVTAARHILDQLNQR